MTHPLHATDMGTVVGMASVFVTLNGNQIVASNVLLDAMVPIVMLVRLLNLASSTRSHSNLYFISV